MSDGFPALLVVPELAHALSVPIMVIGSDMCIVGGCMGVYTQIKLTPVIFYLFLSMTEVSAPLCPGPAAIIHMRDFVNALILYIKCSLKERIKT